MKKAKKVPVSAHIIEPYSASEEQVGDGQPQPTNKSVKYSDLYLWYAKLPEMRYGATTFLDDILGEGWTIRSLNSKNQEAARAHEDKVKAWMRDNKFAQVLYASLLDWVITGNGYLGKAFVTQGQVLELIDKTWDGQFQKSADVITKMEILERIKIENPLIFSPRKIFALKSSNIRIDYDIHGTVKGYVQLPSHNTIQTATNPNDESTYRPLTNSTITPTLEFNPDEVIHFVFEPVGDDIYGNSPFLTCIYDLAALWYAKQYGAVFFQNDATPSKIIILEEESPDGDNFKRCKEEFQKHKANPHRNMLMTGKVTIEDLQKYGKDLEFLKAIDKYTQAIHMPLGITPKTKHLIFGEQLPDNKLLESYYKRINRIQVELEDTLNNELFKQFDVEFEFNRVYKRDESREADIVQKLVGKPIWTPNEGREYVGMKVITDDPMMDEVESQAQAIAGMKSEVQAADSRAEQQAKSPSSKGKKKEENEDKD